MRRALAILAMAVGLVVMAQPAMAVSWGPNSSYYNGTKRVTGNGVFYNSGSTYAKNAITVADNRNDGNNVYGKTTFLFYGTKCPSGQCQTKYWAEGTSGTPEFANTTRSYTHQKGLASYSNSARADTFACAQMGWPVPDSCAAHAYPTFGY